MSERQAQGKHLAVRALVAVIRAYQRFVSPMTGPRCRYYPSCSEYAVQALRTHGAIRGFALALWRLLRCNPFSLGGVDHVPPPRAATTRMR
ncbi:membrane protein insertion efficiency factor YidD [Thermoleophilum album]|uniref:membrane protein insertion efficiency factor YidD n=1 Tax=Thermoleophilum album TaxID=29539 RepID=UPI003D153F1A|nr:membrane protein insertion efficiency factor YidD [Thermoleophilum album]